MDEHEKRHAVDVTERISFGMYAAITILVGALTLMTGCVKKSVWQVDGASRGTIYFPPEDGYIDCACVRVSDHGAHD